MKIRNEIGEGAVGQERVVRVVKWWMNEVDLGVCGNGIDVGIGSYA